MDWVIVIGFAASFLFWASVEIGGFLDAPSRKKPLKEETTSGRVIFALVLLFLVVIAFEIAGGAFDAMSSNYPIFFAGLFLVWIGVIIRTVASLELGEFFTPNVTVFQNQKLVTTGLYSRMRHPSYFGEVLALFGFSLSLLSLSAFLLLIPILLAYMYRIRVEERFLSERFSKEYTRYKRKVRF